MIFQILPQDMLMQVAQYTTAKEVWNSIKVKHHGADLVQKARLRTLRSDLEILKIKPNESENEFEGMLSSIQAKFKSLGEIDTMQFDEAVGRIIAFEERLKSQDEPENNFQNKLLLASSNNQGGGRGHERNFTKNKSSYEKGTSHGSIHKSKLKCYECSEHGHFTKECTKWKDKKKYKEQEALLISEDEEPTLLPFSKAEVRKNMCTYLKNRVGYKQRYFKRLRYEDIRPIFERVWGQNHTFVPIDSEIKKEVMKRSRFDLQQECSKKQKLDEQSEVQVDSDQEEDEMKKYMKIVPDEEITIDAISLATEPPVIFDWKILSEGRISSYHIIRADGSSKRYTSMINLWENIDREDLETLWKLVKAKYEDTRPEEAYERVLWGDLKVMFEPDVKSEVWRNLQGYDVTT
nr:zinc finger, CCHC-type [Tanacetum cinerariifolium]